MIPHDILTLYSAKMLEYGIAILFLVLFIPFWRYVQSSAVAPEPATAKVRVPAPATDWFALPVDRLFHRGHAWLKDEADVLQKLRHPHIIEFAAAVEVGDRFGFLMWPVLADKSKRIIETLSQRLEGVSDEGSSRCSPRAGPQHGRRIRMERTDAG
jgi:hypothetical protein